jgi:amidophosphoribosyltransferase
MPSTDELLATHHRTDEDICRAIGADALIYQNIEALVKDVRLGNPSIERFDCSCFDGNYVTGDVNAAYLSAIEAARKDGAKFRKPSNSTTQLDLNLISLEEEQEETV